jgi:hypothetical protein
LSRAFSDSDLALLAQGINNTCDAQDGLGDGMVYNIKACRFNASALQCSGAKTNGCLSAEQVNAITAAFSGPVNQKTKRSTAVSLGIRVLLAPVGAVGN